MLLRAFVGMASAGAFPPMASPTVRPWVDYDGRGKETSAHRRARRQRASARLLCTLADACVRLQRHHGSSPPATLRPLLRYVRGPPSADVGEDLTMETGTSWDAEEFSLDLEDVSAPAVAASVPLPISVTASDGRDSDGDDLEGDDDLEGGFDALPAVVLAAVPTNSCLLADMSVQECDSAQGIIYSFIAKVVTFQQFATYTKFVLCDYVDSSRASTVLVKYYGVLPRVPRPGERLHVTGWLRQWDERFISADSLTLAAPIACARDEGP